MPNPTMRTTTVATKRLRLWLTSHAPLTLGIAVVESSGLPLGVGHTADASDAALGSSPWSPSFKQFVMFSQ